MNLIKPKILNIGDTIGIVATSGNLNSEENLIRAVSFFKSKGFNVVQAGNLYDKRRYLAGDDDIKIDELHKMFINKNIDAIFCLRGGYGSIRLINKLDYDIIKNNPKIFMGYSDVTALSVMMLKRAGLITYSGPMCLSDFGSLDGDEKTFHNCFDVLMKNNILKYEPFEKGLNIGNYASGITFGGNLTTITSLCGIDFIPDDNFIFFIEDLNEPVYKIDRMISQLLNIQKFKQKIKGIVLGEFLNIDNVDWFNQIFEEVSNVLNIPVLGNFRITHDNVKITVPIGVKAEIKDNKFIIFNK